MSGCNSTVIKESGFASFEAGDLVINNSTGTVVLVESAVGTNDNSFRGVVVNDGSCTIRYVGEYLSHWDCKLFSPFAGTIQLSQGKD